jgi:hypothetical protein
MNRSLSRLERCAARGGAASIGLLGLLALGCAPRAGSLKGMPAPATFPRAELAPGHKRIVFRWEYADQALGARGEGVARVAPPDSVRLDFFLDGGVAGGFAVVVGDSIYTPGGNDVRRYLPPVALLWAALGRLAIPAAPDTVAKVDGGVLRADIGRDPTWRIAFVGDQLTRVERIVDGRRVEWVNRSGSEVRYQHERASRSLTLRITSTDAPAAPFDPEIWRH